MRSVRSPILTSAGTLLIFSADPGHSSGDTGSGISTAEWETFLGKVVILTPGSSYRPLGVPGEEEFRQAGTGVSYCGTCDAPFYKDKVVVAVGGGNTAVEDTLHLAKYAKKVYMVHRRQEFRATPVLVDELMELVNKADSNLELKLDSVVTSIEGEGKVEKAVLKNVKTEAAEEIPCDGVFIFVGMIPNTGFLTGFVDLTEHGFIQCDPAYLRTKTPGVFVAGDCRVGAAMQLVTAVADGVNAATAPTPSTCPWTRWPPSLPPARVWRAANAFG